MDEPKFNLDLDNPEFQQAYQLLTQTNVNVFLTGRAGTGKSTFLRYICNKIRKNYVVLAPTGVAAVNVGGVTVHSFFQMPLRPVPPDDPDYSVKSFYNTNKLSAQKKKLIRELDLIIIDEVSMVRADMIDFIDRVLRGVRRKRGIPFGGVQLLLVGDIFQLEPVVTNDTKAILARYYSDFFFFNAMAYRQVRLVSVELKKMYRQNDEEFIKLLDKIRLNRTSDEDIALLNSRRCELNLKEKEQTDEFSIILASRREDVASINREKLAALDGEERIYEGEVEDDFPERILPTDMSLSLKVGAQVMLVRNDKDRRWVNGTLAKVLQLGADDIMVELENGDSVRVEREIWENISYKFDEKEKRVVEQVIGRFSQFPLKAAWALTIHKSQGLTFNNVTIDMGPGAFTAGQTYVALSRCRTLEGIQFVNPLRKYDVIVSRGATEFSKNFNDAQAAAAAMREAETKRLSAKALEAFEGGEMGKAVETVWDIHNLSGSLARKSVRRFVARILAVIEQLKKKLTEQQKSICKISKEISENAKTLAANGENDEMVMKFLESALALDERNTNAMLNMAISLINNKKSCQAEKWLDRIIKLKDGNFVEASLLKGDLYADKGEISDASIHYQKAAKKSGKDKRAIHRLIELYAKAGMCDVAEEWKNWL